MKVIRKKLNDLFEQNWCPRCGKITPMQGIAYLPGILRKQCKICKGSIVANFLDSESDMITIPDDLIIPTEGDNNDTD